MQMHESGLLFDVSNSSLQALQHGSVSSYYAMLLLTLLHCYLVRVLDKAPAIDVTDIGLAPLRPQQVKATHLLSKG